MSSTELSAMLYGYLRGCLVLAVLALAAAVLFRRTVLRSVPDKPASLAQPLWRKALLGLGLGAAALLPCILLPAALGLYNPAHSGWQSFLLQTDLAGARGGLAVAGLLVVQTLAEELFFRALLLVLLGTLFYWQTTLLLTPPAFRRDPALPAAVRWHKLVWLGSGILAAGVIAAAFGMVHQGNSGATALAVANIALAGFALNLLFWLQGDISGAWALHWLWNTLQAWCGLPVSGLLLSAPAFGIGAAGAVPGLLTGGAFGPEGGIIATATLSGVSLWLLWQGWRSVSGSGAASASTPAR